MAAKIPLNPTDSTIPRRNGGAVGGPGSGLPHPVVGDIKSKLAMRRAVHAVALKMASRKDIPTRAVVMLLQKYAEMEKAAAPWDAFRSAFSLMGRPFAGAAKSFERGAKTVGQGLSWAAGQYHPRSWDATNMLRLGWDAGVRPAVGVAGQAFGAARNWARNGSGRLSRAWDATMGAGARAMDSVAAAGRNAMTRAGNLGERAYNSAYMGASNPYGAAEGMFQGMRRGVGSMVDRVSAARRSAASGKALRTRLMDQNIRAGAAAAEASGASAARAATQAAPSAGSAAQAAGAGAPRAGFSGAADAGAGAGARRGAAFDGSGVNPQRVQAPNPNAAPAPAANPNAAAPPAAAPPAAAPPAAAPPAAAAPAPGTAPAGGPSVADAVGTANDVADLAPGTNTPPPASPRAVPAWEQRVNEFTDWYGRKLEQNPLMTLGGTYGAYNLANNMTGGNRQPAYGGYY